MLRRSIATTLIAWFAATAFILVSAAVWWQYRALSRDLAGEDDQLLLETSAAVQRGLAGQLAEEARGDTLRDQRLLGDWRQTSTSSDAPALRMLGASCTVLEVVTRKPLPPPDCTPAGKGTHLRSWHTTDTTEWRISQTRLEPAGMVLEVLLDRSTDIGVLARFRHQLYTLLLLALVAAVILGFFIARRGLAPLRSLAQRIANIDENQLKTRLATAEAPPEVQELTAAFDAMLMRLDGAFTALSGYSGELAHDLRTPLHVLRQRIEVSLRQIRTPDEYRDVLGSSLEDIGRLQRMADDILFLARAEDPRTGVRRQALTLADELEAIRDYMDPVADSLDITITVDAERALSIDGDGTLLRRAMVNLISNALGHTPRGGSIVLRAVRRDGMTELVVADSGAGIPPSALPHVFDRFYRAPRLKAPELEEGNGLPNGAGLGLAIVRTIARLHGGDAVAESDEKGTRIRLVLPASRVDG